MGLSYNQVAGRRLDRIAALSDGVFAIAMTLIVLEIRVPKPEEHKPRKIQIGTGSSNAIEGSGTKK